MIDKDILKVKEIFQDTHVNLFYPISNSTTEGLIITETLIKAIVEDSDEIEGNITIIVKENKKT